MQTRRDKPEPPIWAHQPSPGGWPVQSKHRALQRPDTTPVMSPGQGVVCHQVGRQRPGTATSSLVPADLVAEARQEFPRWGPFRHDFPEPPDRSAPTGRPDTLTRQGRFQTEGGCPDSRCSAPASASPSQVCPGPLPAPGKGLPTCRTSAACSSGCLGTSRTAGGAATARLRSPLKPRCKQMPWPATVPDAPPDASGERQQRPAFPIVLEASFARG